MALPAGLKPDKLGQYEVGGKTYIRLDGNAYEKTFDPMLNKWRLKHPTAPDAYSPVLEHNGEGAWHHRFERPLEWDRVTLLRRLGPLTDGIDATTLEKIADISGVNDDALRKIHTDNLRLPSALSDTLRQFQTDRQLNEMIEQIRLDQPVPDSRYNDILPQVINMPRWPQGRVIEVFDNASLSGASSGYGDASTPVKPNIRISREDVSAGKLPERVLAALDEEEIVRLLGGGKVRGSRQSVKRFFDNSLAPIFRATKPHCSTSSPRTPRQQRVRFRSFDILSAVYRRTRRKKSWPTPQPRNGCTSNKPADSPPVCCSRGVRAPGCLG